LATIWTTPFRAQAGDGVAGDHPRGHGEDEADDAAEEAAQRGDDEHDERVDVEGAAHDLGFHEVLQREVRGEHDAGAQRVSLGPVSPSAVALACAPPSESSVISVVRDCDIAS
jgi:hypothetical protein